MMDNNYYKKLKKHWFNVENGKPSLIDKTGIVWEIKWIYPTPVAEIVTGNFERKIAIFTLNTSFSFIIEKGINSI